MTLEPLSLRDARFFPFAPGDVGCGAVQQQGLAAAEAGHSPHGAWRLAAPCSSLLGFLIPERRWAGFPASRGSEPGLSCRDHAGAPALSEGLPPPGRESGVSSLRKGGHVQTGLQAGHTDGGIQQVHNTRCIPAGPRPRWKHRWTEARGYTAEDNRSRGLWSRVTGGPLPTHTPPAARHAHRLAEEGLRGCLPLRQRPKSAPAGAGTNPELPPRRGSTTTLVAWATAGWPTGERGWSAAANQGSLWGRSRPIRARLGARALLINRPRPSGVLVSPYLSRHPEFLQRCPEKLPFT